MIFICIFYGVRVVYNIMTSIGAISHDRSIASL